MPLAAWGGGEFMYGTRKGDEEYIYLTVKGGVKGKRGGPKRGCSQRLLVIIVKFCCQILIINSIFIFNETPAVCVFLSLTILKMYQTIRGRDMWYRLENSNFRRSHTFAHSNVTECFAVGVQQLYFLAVLMKDLLYWCWEMSLFKWVLQIYYSVVSFKINRIWWIQRSFICCLH